jgi:hypothetical protein
MQSQILEKVTVAVVTAVVLGALTLLWNWGSQGGVVRALGGVTRDEAIQLIGAQSDPLAAKIKADLRMGIEIIPAPGGNGKSRTCPEGSVMVGALWQVDGGGPHGILSWVSPICRTMGK